MAPVAGGVREHAEWRRHAEAIWANSPVATAKAVATQVESGWLALTGVARRRSPDLRTAKITKRSLEPPSVRTSGRYRRREARGAKVGHALATGQGAPAFNPAITTALQGSPLSKPPTSGAWTDGECRHQTPNESQPGTSAAALPRAAPGRSGTRRQHLGRLESGRAAPAGGGRSAASPGWSTRSGPGLKVSSARRSGGGEQPDGPGAGPDGRPGTMRPSDGIDGGRPARRRAAICDRSRSRSSSSCACSGIDLTQGQREAQRLPVPGPC